MSLSPGPVSLCRSGFLLWLRRCLSALATSSCWQRLCTCCFVKRTFWSWCLRGRFRELVLVHRSGCWRRGWLWNSRIRLWRLCILFQLAEFLSLCRLLWFVATWLLVGFRCCLDTALDTLSGVSLAELCWRKCSCRSSLTLPTCRSSLLLELKLDSLCWWGRRLWRLLPRCRRMGRLKQLGA